VWNRQIERRSRPQRSQSPSLVDDPPEQAFQLVERALIVAPPVEQLRGTLGIGHETRATDQRIDKRAESVVVSQGGRSMDDDHQLATSVLQVGDPLIAMAQPTSAAGLGGQAP
jgi:hypothetical protein